MYNILSKSKEIIVRPSNNYIVIILPLCQCSIFEQIILKFKNRKSYQVTPT